MRLIFGKQLLAGSHLGDFFGEVLLLLLDALALLEADSILQLDLAAQLLGALGDILLNGQLAILDELLLQQAVLGVELVQLALDDLGDLPAILGSLDIWTIMILRSSSRTSSVT